MKFNWKKYDKYMPYAAIVILMVLIVGLMLLAGGGNDTPVKDEVAEDVPFVFDGTIHMDMSGSIIQKQEDGSYTTTSDNTNVGYASSLYSVAVDEYAFNGRRNILEHLCKSYNMIDASEYSLKTTGRAYEITCKTPGNDMDSRELVYGADGNGYVLKYTERISSENMSTVTYSRIANNIINITGYNFSIFNADVNKLVTSGKGVLEKHIVNTSNNDEITLYVNNKGEFNWEVSVAIRSKSYTNVDETPNTSEDAVETTLE